MIHKLVYGSFYLDLDKEAFFAFKSNFNSKFAHTLCAFKPFQYSFQKLLKQWFPSHVVFNTVQNVDISYKCSSVCICFKSSVIYMLSGIPYMCPSVYYIICHIIVISDVCEPVWGP